MDTVNMLNTMRFYCQPILPLVYDESMSYYETLCKVVGQLNTTGETVNKLNEGLTNEIADRQAADAALDERLKTLESTNAKIHFLAFAGTPPYDAKPIYAMPTRSELRQWVTDGDMIVTLMQTTDEGRNIVYAASCAYNAPNWENASFDGFNIIVPISTDYDSEGNYAVRQKIAKITIPPASAASLDEKWGLQFIEINTPHTSAEGMVNFTATVVGETVTASITPAEFIKLFDAASATTKLCVGVNARLNYNALELSSSVATVYDNSSAKREVRITFVQDPHAGRRGYVPSEIFDLVNIVGDKDTNTWKVETFGTELFGFQRYEGFRFTRKAGDIIEAAEDCDPASVAQYYNDLPGKDYQNLPIHLIDEVDNADYWNGTFDSYSDGHITFTFTTANYATIGEKMVVRVIELSATRTAAAWVGDEKWVYAAKEFDIPYHPTAFVLDVWQANDTPTIANGRVSYEANSSLDFDLILELVDGAQDIIATLHKGTSETSPEWSGLVYSKMNVANGAGSITFATAEGVTLNNGIPSMNGVVVFSKDAAGVKKVTITFSSALPAPSADGSDDGKVPTVDGVSWGLKEPVITVTSTKVTSLGYDASEGATKWTVLFDESFDSILANLAANKPMKFNITLPDSTTGLSVSFNTGYVSAGNDSDYIFTGTVANSPVTLSITKLGSATVYLFESYLPSPNPDDSDDGKTLVVNKHKWELKTPTGGGSSDAVLYTPQTLTDAQKKQARDNVDAAGVFVVKGTIDLGGAPTLDKTFAQIKEAINAGKSPIAVYGDEIYLALTINDETAIMFSGIVVDRGVPKIAGLSIYSNESAEVFLDRFLILKPDGTMAQTSMVAGPTEDMQIATKKYVDDAVSRAPITIKLGDNNAATSAATVDEIKAALEAGNAPVLESAAGDIFCFVLNWRPSSSSRFTIQYGTFDFNTDGKAAFDIYTVNVNAAGITYVINTFVSA